VRPPRPRKTAAASAASMTGTSRIARILALGARAAPALPAARPSRVRRVRRRRQPPNGSDDAPSASSRGMSSSLVNLVNIANINLRRGSLACSACSIRRRTRSWRAGRQAHRPAPARCPASRGWQPSHGTGIAIVSSFRRRDGDRRRQAPRRVCFRRLYLSPSRTGPAANRRSVASLTPVGVHGGRDLTPSRRTGESSARATRRPPVGAAHAVWLAGACSHR
jgi:hypothetical protein